MSKRGLVVSEGDLLRGKEVVSRRRPFSGEQDVPVAHCRSHFWEKLQLQ